MTFVIGKVVMTFHDGTVHERTLEEEDKKEWDQLDRREKEYSVYEQLADFAKSSSQMTP